MGRVFDGEQDKPPVAAQADRELSLSIMVQWVKPRTWNLAEI